MKTIFYYIIILSFVFISCSNNKNTVNGVTFSYKKFKSTAFKKQLKEDYLFSNIEINSLIKITEKNFIENHGIKKKLVRIYLATSDNNMTINQNMLGLYVFTSAKHYPNFLFLITENDIVYFKCDEKSMYQSVLEKSYKIDDSIKINISKFIESRCLNDDKMSWTTGRLF